MKECVGSINISLDNHVAYAFRTILFKSTVYIVSCYIYGICGGEMSYAFINVIYLRFFYSDVG